MRKSSQTRSNSNLKNQLYHNNISSVTNHNSSIASISPFEQQQQLIKNQKRDA